MPFLSPKNLCRRHGLTPNTDLGQHFLLHPHQAQRLVAALELDPTATVVEIGAGLGALTVFLAEAAAHVVALEVDERLVAILQSEVAAAHPQVQILRQDILDFDLVALSRAVGRPLALIGNLPYQITSPLLFKLLQEKAAVHIMVLMMQLEVGQRLLAQPGSKEYGILSVLLQYHFRLERLFTLGPQNFYPAPKVESVVLRGRPRHPEVAAEDEAALQQVVKAAFATRRKTLKNALGAHCHLWHLTQSGLVDLLLQLGIDPTRRPETLAVEEFVKLSNALTKRQPSLAS